MKIITRGFGPDDLIVTRGLWFLGEEIELTIDLPFINKGDELEKIRDQIALILSYATTQQQAAATAAGEDPELWRYRVYSERINPWEILTKSDNSPIINIWVDGQRYDEGSSNLSTRQKAITRYNIDIYCHKESEQTAGGHDSGDELTAKLAHNTAKLVRNVLMHDGYRYLQMQGVVWRRWIESITVFQPQSGNQAVERVIGCRVALDVEHNETIILAEPNILELVNVKFRHEPDGQIVAEMEYDGD